MRVAAAAIQQRGRVAPPRRATYPCFRSESASEPCNDNPPRGWANESLQHARPGSASTRHRRGRRRCRTVSRCRPCRATCSVVAAASGMRRSPAPPCPSTASAVSCAAASRAASAASGAERGRQCARWRQRLPRPAGRRPTGTPPAGGTRKLCRQGRTTRRCGLVDLEWSAHRHHGPRICPLGGA